MRNWFPFTDYDFYGYLSSGAGFLFVCDLAFNGGAITFRPEWTFVQVVLAVAAAYAAGQLMAWPSSLFLEHLLTHRILHSPFDIQVGAAAPRCRERAVNAVLTGRDFRPLDEDTRDLLVSRASNTTGKNVSIFKDDPARLFDPAYEFAKTVPQTKERMDQFRNLYGMMRNLAFTGLLSAVVFAGRAWAMGDNQLWTWAAIALLGGLGMLIRYWKFYGAFASEITRCYAFHEPPKN